MKRVAIYARVSTSKQNVDNQLLALHEVAKRHDWLIVDEYVDRGISGSKGRDKRPAFNELLKAANRKEFDVIMTWSVDRLGRNLSQLVMFLEELQQKNVDLYLHKEGIDTSTPMGQTFYHISSVFAQMERERIRERVMAGLERAKASGVKLGRPCVDANMELAIRTARASGMGMNRIGKKLGCGTSTVQRVLANG